MIYHYTDLNAAKSITENSQVWLTDYRYLNDKEEFSKGFEVLCEALEKYQIYTEKYSKEFLDDLVEAIELIRGDDFYKPVKNNIFVSSFSKSSDLLSQWRSYGMYCLELDEDFFREDDIYLLDCHYIQNMGDALDYADGLISDYILPELLRVWTENKEFLFIDLSSLIEIYALSFKHEAFIDENEIRFVISCEDDDQRINFRVKGQLLIPYIPVKFDPQLLKSITIGPIDNQELALDSLAMFTTKIARKVQLEEGNIEYDLSVENSDIPYRSI